MTLPQHTRAPGTSPARQSFMEKITFPQKALVVLAACVITFVAAKMLGASWITISEITPTVAILVVAFFAAFYGLQEAVRFKKGDELEEFKDTLWNRNIVDKTTPDHAMVIQNGDRLVAYADRTIDRQINKARGILPFNSIIMTVLSIERNRLPTPAINDIWTSGSLYQYWLPTVVFLAILLTLGFSSWYCLSLFLVRWGPHEEYITFRDEFDRTIDLVNRRSRRIQWATVLSEACLFIGLFLVVMIEASVLSHSPPHTERSNLGAPFAAHSTAPTQ
jgi:hypothetical protein